MKGMSHDARVQKVAEYTQEFVNESLSLPSSERPSVRAFMFRVWINTGQRERSVMKAIELLGCKIEDDRVVKL